METQLSRQQRRALERQNNKKPTYNMTRTQVVETTKTTIAQELEKAKKDLSIYYTGVIASAFFIGLHDKFGFGEYRLKKLLVAVGNTMDSVTAGTVTLEDLVQICNDEFDIDVLGDECR